MVKPLLDKHAVDPDSRDRRGQTPLSWAAKKGYKAVAKLLLAKDTADPDSRDRNDQTPLS